MASEQEIFMREALTQAEAALNAIEIPVGCVLVRGEKGDKAAHIIAKGSNQTNVSRNGTRHAEIVAIESLFVNPRCDEEPFASPLLSDCDLYVTCEPCIMCAAALSKLAIRKVYFGCHNERFGGNGSILHVQEGVYSTKLSSSSSSSSSSAVVTTTSSDEYFAYPIEAGLLKDEAIDLFQRFYTMENQRAPEGKRKRRPEKPSLTSDDADGCNCNDNDNSNNDNNTDNKSSNKNPLIIKNTSISCRTNIPS